MAGKTDKGDYTTVRISLRNHSRLFKLGTKKDDTFDEILTRVLNKYENYQDMPDIPTAGAKSEGSE